MAASGDRGASNAASIAVLMLLSLGCSPDPAGVDRPEVEPAREPASQAPPGTEDAAGEGGGTAPPPDGRAAERRVP